MTQVATAQPAKTMVAQALARSPAERTHEERDAIVLANLGLVHKLWHLYRHRWQPLGLEEDDALQAGFLALVKAAAGYDPTAGAVFSTYACLACKRYMDLAARERLMIWVPEGSTAPLVPVYSLETVGRGPEDDEAMTYQPADRPRYRSDRDLWEYLLRHVSAADREAVRLHYGEGLDFKDCGRRLGVSPMRAQQYVERARRRLWHVLRSRRKEVGQ